ncbi:MAG TPA: multifunctional CCA addition/repair protein [Casimicrobiaceae bacterium]|nr:multifunctional CCA addition/repair protein [Casimicrobiaceae bacterium]
MKIYRVGGSVRDELLGRKVADRDFVVVGATPEQMTAAGYRPVGSDFPVFLHPQTNDEYALARTERKSGRGYRGFVFHTTPDVTLEADLARRDLTINAIARDDDGTLIDPHGGVADLRAGILRHVSPAFAEDPLRVLRVARFAARFGFSVAPETEALLREIAAGGELATLTAERVWQELAKALMEARPSLFFEVLRRCGALGQLLPEVDALFGVPQPPAHHPEIDTGVHLMLALDFSAAAGDPLAVRYAVLAHDLGKATTEPAQWPRHVAHEARSVALARQLSERLRVPADCAELARLAARYHGDVHRADELRVTTLLDLLLATDALRRPERLDGLLRACAADALSRPDRGGESYAPGKRLRAALAIVRGVDAGAIAESHPDAADLPQRIRTARLEALRAWGKTNDDDARQPGEPSR